jgi:hypothetical protein
MCTKARAMEEIMTESEIVRSKSQGRHTIILMKGNEHYAQWVEHLSQATRIPRVTLFDLALADWAQRNGYQAPPVRL